MLVRPYLPDDDEEWDKLVGRSWNGTFLHTRLYLAYHGSRFLDRSLVIEDGKGRVVGVFPAAQDPLDATVVTSHPGLTYGGIVHDGFLRGEHLLAALTLLIPPYQDQGYRELHYKAVPHIYHRVPAQDDLYALFRLGSRRESCDLSATIDLANRESLTHGRKSGQKLATRAGVTTNMSWDNIGPFWTILTQNLSERHDAAPTHSVGEIRDLQSRFPDRISLCTATLDASVVAGCVLFCAGPVVHTQYVATSSDGRSTSALDLVIERTIEFAMANDYRYFDFGISNEGHGGPLNNSLHEFKISFGAGGVVHDDFRLPLNARSSLGRS